MDNRKMDNRKMDNRKTNKNRGTNKSEGSRSNASLADVFQDTLTHSRRTYPYKGDVSLLYDFEVPQAVKNAQPKSGLILGTFDKDCVIVASDIVGKVGLINMASPRRPGGGVINGAKAQEEHLCRCSNLWLALNSVREDIYPLDRFATVITPDVTFFKNTNYRLSSYFKCTVLSVAADKVSPQKFTEQHFIDVKRKIRSLCGAAVLSGSEHLVLSALGCGAFGNPPDRIAEAFRQVLVDEKFQFYFETIRFSVIDDHNSNGNYAAFARVFSVVDVVPEKLEDKIVDTLENCKLSEN